MRTTRQKIRDWKTVGLEKRARAEHGSKPAIIPPNKKKPIRFSTFMKVPKMDEYPVSEFSYVATANFAELAKKFPSLEKQCNLIDTLKVYSEQLTIKSICFSSLLGESEKKLRILFECDSEESLERYKKIVEDLISSLI